ncbi:MAG: hypothetical protein GY842_21210 [bacterium]|nr:hypothetical protein [bacterium]
MDQRHRWIAALAVLPVLVGVGRSAAVGMDAQRIVVRRGVAALPPELSSFFESRLTDLEERVVEPDGAWRRDRQMRLRRHWGRLWIDVQARDASLSARLAAAEGFPRREADARRLFKSLGHGKAGGQLPWAIEELHGELVDAFQREDHDEIVKAAGHLAHFAWAASEPFAVTTDHRGQDGGNLDLGELAMGAPYYPHQSVRQRVSGELVRRYRNRYLERVQVRPRDLHPTTHTLDRTFRQMIASLGRVDDLLTTDRELTEQLGAHDGPTLVSRQDEYYELLDERCGDIVVDRLQSAAGFTADLIAGAWDRAGRPPLAAPRDHPREITTPLEESSRSESPDEPEPEDVLDPADARFVGSKYSNVYHLSKCKHVERIRSWNLVAYESTQEAEREGKRPCRICHPERAGGG